MTPIAEAIEPFDQTARERIAFPRHQRPGGARVRGACALSDCGDVVRDAHAGCEPRLLSTDATRFIAAVDDGAVMGDEVHDPTE